MYKAKDREAQPWILTVTGRAFDLLAPTSDMVRIEDIAHHLSMLCRFTGACKIHYSVAQHSVYVSRLVPESMRLVALLHDAHEAYIGDLSSPLKTAMRRLGFDTDELATPIDVAIGGAFGVDLVNQPPEIRHADLVMLATEMRDLVGHPKHVTDKLPPPRPAPIIPFDARMAESVFLDNFRLYTGDIT